MILVLSIRGFLFDPFWVCLGFHLCPKSFQVQSKTDLELHVLQTSDFHEAIQLIQTFICFDPEMGPSTAQDRPKAAPRRFQTLSAVPLASIVDRFGITTKRFWIVLGFSFGFGTSIGVQDQPQTDQEAETVLEQLWSSLEQF